MRKRGRPPKDISAILADVALTLQVYQALRHHNLTLLCALGFGSAEKARRHVRNKARNATVRAYLPNDLLGTLPLMPTTLAPVAQPRRPRGRPRDHFSKAEDARVLFSALKVEGVPHTEARNFVADTLGIAPSTLDGAPDSRVFIDRVAVRALAGHYWASIAKNIEQTYGICICTVVFKLMNLEA